MGELYAPDILRLAQNPETAKIAFDRKVFDEVVEWLHREGHFSADMLSDSHARRLIEATYDVLNGAIGASITQEVPEELTAALRNNAFIFSGFKSYNTLAEIGLELTDDKGAVKPFAKFAEDVRKIDERYNGAYLFAEYNHAVHSSQMAVKWHDIIKDGDEYNLQYRTAGDDRVREAHARLDGVTLPPSDKFWDHYLPPNGWNCRCQVVQVLREDYAVSDSDAATKWGDECTREPKQQIFRFNAGKELKLFPPKHPYMPKGCGNCQLKLQLAWGKGKEECVACRSLTRYLLKFSRSNALAQLNREKRSPVKMSGENGGHLYTGRLYCSNNDRENVIQHCHNPHEIIIAKRIDDILMSMRFIRVEQLIDKKNTPKKIARGVQAYTVYEFESEIMERGQMVRRSFILKCEIVKKNKQHPVEYPYCIKPKE